MDSSEQNQRLRILEMALRTHGYFTPAQIVAAAVAYLRFVRGVPTPDEEPKAP